MTANSLKSTIARRFGRPPTQEDIVGYLNSSRDPNMSNRHSDIASTWSRARISTRAIQKTIPNLCWKMGERPYVAMGDHIPKIDWLEKTLKTSFHDDLLRKFLQPK